MTRPSFAQWILNAFFWASLERAHEIYEWKYKKKFNYPPSAQPYVHSSRSIIQFHHSAIFFHIISASQLVDFVRLEKHREWVYNLQVNNNNSSRIDVCSLVFYYLFIFFSTSSITAKFRNIMYQRAPIKKSLILRARINCVSCNDFFHRHERAHK